MAANDGLEFLFEKEITPPDIEDRLYEEWRDRHLADTLGKDSGGD